MVNKAGTYQTNCNAGEFAPECRGNWGLKQYYSGLKLARNIAPIPQGGFTLLPRTRFVADFGAGDAAVRWHRFSVSDTDHYMVALHAGQIRIFKGATQVATVAVPYVEADVPLVKAVQRFETMLLTHKAYAPRRLIRGGDDHTWTLDTVAFLNLPQVDYGATYTPVNETWGMKVGWTSSVTKTSIGIILSVDGEETSLIPLQASDSDTVALIRSALEALSGVDNGLTVVVGSGGTSTTAFWDITFTGGRNPGANFSVSGRSLNTEASVTTWRSVKGVPGGEPLISSGRGWPACSVFYQDRWCMGGFAAKPSAWAASRTGEYFDFNTQINADSAAILINIDTDGAEEIIWMVQGVYLFMFSTRGEYHVSDRAIKRNAPPNIVRSSTNGSSKRIRPVNQENGLIYASAGETMLQVATYDAVTTTFTSAPLTLLSSHLARGLVDMDLQKPLAETDAQRLWVVRDDGGMSVAHLIRNQDVAPFTRWETAGSVRAVGVDGANRVFLVVARQVGGVTHQFVEVIEAGLLFDAALTVTGAARTVVTGLGIHEGATVWADVDGWIEGPFVVAGGQITLPYAGTTVTVGRWTPPEIETLPIARDVGNRTVLKRPARVHTVQLDVIDTEALAVGANGRPARPVGLARVGDPVDQPTPPFTGEVRVCGLVGWHPEGTVTVTQTRPGGLQVRDITIQART